jgi:hypothetical protein
MPMSTQGSAHYEWTEATDFRYYGAAEWLPMLAQLRDSGLCRGLAFDFAIWVIRHQSLGDQAPAWTREVRVPRCFSTRWERLKGSLPYITLFVQRRFLQRLVRGEQPAECILRFELGPPPIGPVRDMAELSLPDDEPVPHDQAPDAVLGVIDDGIAFAHDRFLAEDRRTRIEYLWDMGAPVSQGPWGLGQEIDKRTPQTGIDALMQGCRHGGLVDEDQVYRRSGFSGPSRRGFDPLARRMAHGTHVLDLACHAGASPPAGKRPIVAVQLPGAAVADTSGATLGATLLLAFFYVLWRAECVAWRARSQPLPLVVNISMGIHAGPHDGSSLFEGMLDALIVLANATGAAPTRVVLPSGNQRQARGHACLDVPGHSQRQLLWRLLPDDQSPSELQIWLPPGTDTQALRVRIAAPDGTPSPPLDATHPLWTHPSSVSCTRFARYAQPDPSTGRSCITVILAPTADLEGRAPVVPAGLWRISLDNTGAAPVVGVHAWIQRDDTAPGHRLRGRQSYFEDAAYMRHDIPGRPVEFDGGGSHLVSRAGAYNAYASGQHPVVVGGYRRNDRRIAPYAGIGPTLPPGRGAPNPLGPDVLLPCDDSASRPGLLAAGTRSGSCVAMGGTSVAAPLAANWLLQRCATQKPSDRTAIFYAASTKEGNTPDRPALPFGGGGRLDWPDIRKPR